MNQSGHWDIYDLQKEKMYWELLESQENEILVANQYKFLYLRSQEKIMMIWKDMINTRGLWKTLRKINENFASVLKMIQIFLSMAL